MKRRVLTARLRTCWVYGSGRTSGDSVWLDPQELSQCWKWRFAVIHQQVIVDAMNVSVLLLPVGICVERAARRVQRRGRKKVRGHRS